jgi:hypothetical protein
MRMTVVTVIVALALIVCVACELAGPETVPKNPGTVIARVADDSGAPLARVWVYVHDIPNAVGSTFSVGVPTNASGTSRIEAIPAGRRRVEVKPPPGYAAPEAVAVDVVKGVAVTVAFALTRGS